MILQNSCFIYNHKVFFVYQLHKAISDYNICAFMVTDINGKVDTKNDISLKVSGVELEFIKKNLIDIKDLKKFPHLFI